MTIAELIRQQTVALMAENMQVGRYYPRPFGVRVSIWW